jgi:minor extracellular protease Epr
VKDLPGKRESRVHVHLPYLLVFLICVASLPAVVSYDNWTNTISASATAPPVPMAMSSSVEATLPVNTTTTSGPSNMARLIVHETSASKLAQLQLEGCEVIHELINATAIACPANLKVPNSEPDALLQILDLSADIQIKADQVWAQGYTGSGVTVAVLDTGVDATHPELSSSIVGGKSFVAYTQSYADDNGHGTHVSGIITADGIVKSNSKGAAYAANVWMGKVCDGAGSCYYSDIASGIQYVVLNNIARVISISIGGSGTTASNCDGDFLAQKVNWAYDNTVVSVIASGNDGSSSWVDSPACASKAIAVGAVTNVDTLASFSNQGSAMQDHGVAAPGVNIYSTLPNGGYASWSGTSMATPHVSATIALVLQKDPILSSGAIRSAIFGSADCVQQATYGSCPNTHIGYGRVDALNAVLSVPRAIVSTVASTSYVSATTGSTSTIYTGTTTVTSPVVIYATTTVMGTTTVSSSTTKTSSSSTTVSSTTTRVTSTTTRPCGRICNGAASASPTVAALADPFALLFCLGLLIVLRRSSGDPVRLRGGVRRSEDQG